MANWWTKFVDLLFGGPRPPAAYEPKEAAAISHDTAPVRDAGTEAMRDPPRKWSKEDEESDASFPASDPPGNY